MKRVNIINSGSIIKTITWYLVMLYLVIVGAVVLTSAHTAFAESLEDFVRSSHGQAGGLAESSNSAEKFIPQYSEKLSHVAANEMANKDDNALKDEANKKIIEAKQGKGSGADQIIVEVSKKKPLDNIENHEIFKKAEKVYASPLSELNGLTDEKCKHLTNDQRNQYSKKTLKTKKQDIEYEEITCEKPDETITCENILEVTCAADGGGDCDSGGIVKDSIESDMDFSYDYPILTIGTIHDNAWGGKCQLYDRNTKFKIKNLEEIKEFKLSRVGFDDYLWIELNGHTVYVGPDGGNRIELTTQKGGWWSSDRTVVSNGIGTHSCERNTNWDSGSDNLASIDLDLKPYLNNGENEIWMRVIVYGAGEGWMQITAKQYCCNKFIDTWTKKCKSG